MSIAEEPLEEALSLWRSYAEKRRELQDRGLCRSCKDPEADFAEWLVQRVLGGEIVENKSHPDYDVIAGEKRIQVRKYGKAPGNKAPMATGLQEDASRRPTHYAFVDYAEGIPQSIYLCTYEWVDANAAPGGGLSIVRVRKAAASGTSAVEVYPLQHGESRRKPPSTEELESDPLMRLFGTVHSPVPDVAERHDEYLGQALMAELRDESDAGNLH